MPLAFTVAPCNENDKVYFKTLLQAVHGLGVEFKTVLADAQAAVRCREPGLMRSIKHFTV